MIKAENSPNSYHDITEAMYERTMACSAVRECGFTNPFIIFHKLVDDYTVQDYTNSEVKLYKLLNSSNGYAILRALLAQRGLTEQELK